ARAGATPPKSVPEADLRVRAGDVQSAAPVYEAAAAKGSPSTVLGRARVLVAEAAHRRPVVVLTELGKIIRSGEQVSPEAQRLLVGATREVGTPGAADHVRNALSHGLPLDNSLGRLAVERGTIVRVRDVDTLQTTTVRLPPETDLAERHVYVDSRLRIG